jgi:hypothetical protein
MGGVHDHGDPFPDCWSPVSTGRPSPFLGKGGNDLGIDMLLLQHVLVVEGNVAIDELQTRRLTEAQELKVNQAVLDVVKQVDVLDDLMTLALDKGLNKCRGPEGDSNTDETVLREPVVSDKVR